MGLTNLADYLREAHAIAVSGVLAPHQTTQDSWRRAFAGLGELVDKWEGTP
jgi:hypothetical protein